MPDGASAPPLHRPLWHVSMAGRLHGPLDEAALRRLAAGGQLSPYTLVRREGTAEWRLLAAVPELAALLVRQEAPAPPARPSRLLLWAKRAAVIAFGLFLAGYWVWRLGWIGPDLLELLPGCAPTLVGRRILPQPRLKLPQTYGLYNLAGGETQPCLPGQAPPSYGREVEFLSYGPPNTAAEYSQITQFGPGETENQFAVLRTIDTIGRPLYRRPGMRQFIPAQVLAPGLYQLGPKFAFYIHYDTYRSQLATQAAAAFRERRWPDALAASRMVQSICGLTSDTQLMRRQWADLILQSVASEQTSPNLQTSAILKTCVDWSPASTNRVAELCLARAKDGLAAKPIAVDAIEPLLKLAAEATSTTEPRIGALVWEGLSRRLADPPSLGQEAFTRLFHLCEGDEWLSDTVKLQPAWRLAMALRLDDQGRRGEALPLYQDLATTGSDLAITQVARDRLSPPKPGRREIRQSPVIFKDAKDRPALNIELRAMQVGAREIEFDLGLSNISLYPQTFLFAESADQPAGGQRYDLLSLVDDTGRRYESAGGFVSSRNVAEAQSNLRAIQLASGEQSEIKARFPLPGPGATRVKFVSPRYRNQGSWGWEDLPLKEGPFEPPLPVLPLLDASLAEPETKLAAAAKETSGTTPVLSHAPQSTTPTPIVTPTTHPAMSNPSKVNPAIKVSASKSIDQASKPQAADAPQKQALAFQRQALQERDRCWKRSSSGRTQPDKSFYEAGEVRRQAAEEALYAGDDAKAALYFQQASRIYNGMEN